MPGAKLPTKDAVDKLFEAAFDSKPTPKTVLNISDAPPFTNEFAGNSVIINSDRIIFNTKTDMLFLCGKEGIAITSPGSVHIDCDDDLYLFSGKGEIYLGVPNKGKEIPQNPKQPKTKADATRDYAYEPIVLGIKLTNLLEDLLDLLEKVTLRSEYSDVFMSTEDMYNLKCLKARLPEMLSTVAFVDGFSHEEVSAAPKNTSPGASSTTDLSSEAKKQVEQQAAALVQNLGNYGLQQPGQPITTAPAPGSGVLLPGSTTPQATQPPGFSLLRPIGTDGPVSNNDPAANSSSPDSTPPANPSGTNSTPPAETAPGTGG